jgi:internalin A
MRNCCGVLAMVLLLSGAARADEADAVKLVEKLGGTIKRDDKQPDKPVIEVSLVFTKETTDADLKTLKELKQLKTLLITGPQVTDAGLKELKELKQLTQLDLLLDKMTDAGLKELKELKQLTRLDLSDTQMTDAGVKDFQDALPKCKVSRE